MKRRVIHYFFLVLFSVTATLHAQHPPFPDGGNDPGSNQTPVGGASPIGGGAIIMLVMAAAYAGKKALKVRKRLLE